jgi:hypothetical protein
METANKAIFDGGGAFMQRVGVRRAGEKRLDIRRNRRIYVTVINKRKIPEKCRLQLLRPAESRGDVARTPPQKIRCIAEIFCTNWRVR